MTKILILALNAPPEPVGAAVYTGGLIETLTAMGHEVDLVTAKPYYPDWRPAPGTASGWRRATVAGVPAVRCPLYVPARPTGARRILHHLSFAASALVPTVVRAWRGRPDIVLTVAPSLLAAPVARIAARVAAAKSWLHVQDLEVEAAFATGLVDPRSRAARFARWLERRIVAGFDRVSSISPEMCARLAAIVPPARIVEFRNWADLDAAHPGSAADYARDWGLGARRVALYSGNIANKQGIEILVEAARLLAHRDDIVIVVCGDGPNRARFETIAADSPNIVVRPLQPRARLPDLLALAHVHLLPQRGDAADLVLPSKLANMLASGRPVVATAAPGTGLARELAGCGVATPPEDARAFAAAIEALVDDPAEHARLSAAARGRAAGHWDRRAGIARFAGALDDLVAAR